MADMNKLMELTAQLMNESDVAFLVTAKSGNLRVGLQGSTKGMIALIAQGLIDLSEKSGNPLEEIGKALNVATEKLLKERQYLDREEM